MEYAAAQPRVLLYPHPRTREQEVAIAGLNSAWLSSRRMISTQVHDYGFLAIGEPPLYAAQQSCSEADVRIAAMHHPIGWLCEDDRVVSDDG